MDAPEAATYWKRVIERLYSTDPSDRSWATHVLATKFPPNEKSNLAHALEHCDRANLVAHLEQLARNDPDSTTVTYSEEILRALNSQQI
jgi:hypothetical protein